jgi:hypothetical protein
MTVIYQVTGTETRFFTYKRAAISEAREMARDPLADGEIRVEKCTLVHCGKAELAVRMLEGGWCEKSETVWRTLPRKSRKA